VTVHETRQLEVPFFRFGFNCPYEPLLGWGGEDKISKFRTRGMENGKRDRCAT
jgi:hypothetical protein